MARVLVLYNQPADPAAFDTYYHETHVPLAKKIPGLRGMNLSVAPPTALMGTAPYLVAELLFDSTADMQAALTSPEGQAAAADVPKFAQAGVTILLLQTSPAM
jgi:uncharacterized protein (TIGR02118 family)